MSLTDLYCLAYAPLQGTGLTNVDEVDRFLENIIKEVKYLKKFSACAFENFLSYLESEKCLGKEKSEECAVALCCLLGFLQRMQEAYKGACDLTSAILSDHYSDLSKPMKNLMTATRACGFSPSDVRLESYLDTEPDSEWSISPLIRGKVEFRKSVSIIEGDESNLIDPPEVVHDVIKEGFSRKKCRKATGYTKFNFKEDLEKELTKTMENETDEVVSNKNNFNLSSTIVNKKAPVKQLYASNEKKEENKQKKDAFPSFKSFSILNNCCINRINESNDKSMDKSNSYKSNSFCGMCCISDFREDEINQDNVLRYESSVVLGNVEEIQDPDVDMNWHDNSRHKQRFARIRNRKPTGHPNLLNSASDDFADMLENYGDGV